MSFLEVLEGRRLMSATFQANTGAVVVDGTDGADAVRVARRGEQLLVTVNGARTAFPLADVREVRVATGAGDDRVVINAKVTLPTSLHGGEGNDVLVGGGGADRLDGHTGNDRLSGRGGDDDLRGVAGVDRLAGGAGDDTLLGSPGGGAVSGGPGADRARAPRSARAAAVEQLTINPDGSDADPVVEVYAARADDGTVSVTVSATHSAGGHERTFGELTADPGGKSFSLSVTGRDLAGPGDSRTAALVTETRTYDLGQLAPGAYTLTVRGTGDAVRATIRIGVTADGLTPQTPTAQRSPWM